MIAPLMISFLFWLGACAQPVADPACVDSPQLFGTPTEATGLGTDECAPTCTSCAAGPWTQPVYTAADFADWRAWSLLDPPAALTTDPYLQPAPEAPDDDAVCAMVPSGATYRLQDYPTEAAALAAGAEVTHFGVCGLCSSLVDLAVYAETPDLTEPVRACGLESMNGDISELTACIAAIGFTPACASVWAYNTLNTRDACLSECLEYLDAPYNEPDGSLNPCLQCDEDESGAVFLAVAGRTRRNTGLASSMCRPCSEVRPLVHAYGPPGSASGS